MHTNLTSPFDLQHVPHVAHLIQDEKPYADLVKRFTGRRLGAAEFLPRFAHLWRCEGADGAFDNRTIVPMTRAESSLYGALDRINELCELYWRNLPEGQGCRVSEEQFRQEVESEASTHSLLRASPTP
jgi:hypothetical protein